MELEQATSNFNENNIIGQGRFGLVYKGLLQDGTIVAIKRRLHAPTQYFFQEVNKLAIIYSPLNLDFLCEVVSRPSFDGTS